MNSPTPAIVTQNAVRPLPRWALLLLCLAYVVPGFVGRGPWKNSDVASFGYMLELAQGHTTWLAPQLAGMPPETDGLLPYWLGAWAIQLMPAGLMSPEMAARLPFMALLVLTLAATWYGVYYLARSPGAQPVAFAFGGEATPSDYARAIADGALLALIACLGLAQLSHEATGYLAQLSCAALIFFAVATLPYHTAAPAVALVAGMAGLTLSGAQRSPRCWAPAASC
ncbi:putative inner membrane transmembrane protein, partial [Acidovorax delafieldii 2AN]